jgi:PleD family two-component response regulator
MGEITASFGVSKLRVNETGADLIKRADDRLYDAKAKGRNRVVADASEPPRQTTSRPKRAVKA